MKNIEIFILLIISEIASAHAIHPSCVLNQTCIIDTNQTSAIAVTTSMTPLIIDLGVTISTSAGGYALINQAGNSITNNGFLNIGNGDGFQNNSPLAFFQNNGVIKSFAQLGTIGFDNTSTITILNNRNQIQGLHIGLKNEAGSTIVNLINETQARIGGGGAGIDNQGSISYLFNSGSVSSAFSSGLSNQGFIEVLTNNGEFSGYSTSFGINNTNGSITTLNNSQGSTSAAGVLKYTGVLPANYNVIINSPSNYGKLAVTDGTGSTTFGIHSGNVSGISASTLAKGTYSSVLSGVILSNFTGATSGDYNGFTWVLNNSSGTIWDLIVRGASSADTQQSLVNTASTLQGTFTLQNSVLANSFSYDCPTFGESNVCVSAGGRNTALQAANGLNTINALLIAAYRPHPNYRIGVYADQNLPVSEPSGTVNLSNNIPLIGFFGAWTERLDGTGTEVKVSAGYGQKNTKVTRQVVSTSEAGSGSSQLNSQGAQVTAKYGFEFSAEVIVSPYIGMRYTQNNMNEYSEQATSSVTAPLTYSALNTYATTALAGVGISYRFIPQATAFGSAGVEIDKNTNNGTYSVTGISNLTPIILNANPVNTRIKAMLGVYYDIQKNQRWGVTSTYRQEPDQAISTTTVMATYTIDL